MQLGSTLFPLATRVSVLYKCNGKCYPSYMKRVGDERALPDCRTARTARCSLAASRDHEAGLAQKVAPEAAQCAVPVGRAGLPSRYSAQPTGSSGGCLSCGGPARGRVAALVSRRVVLGRRGPAAQAPPPDGGCCCSAALPARLRRGTAAPAAPPPSDAGSRLRRLVPRGRKERVLAQQAALEAPFTDRRTLSRGGNAALRRRQEVSMCCMLPAGEAGGAREQPD